MLKSFKSGLSFSLKILKLVLRRIYNFLNLIDDSINSKFDQRRHEYMVRRTASKYDMSASNDEKYYAQFYKEFIVTGIAGNDCVESLEICDLACGQGRIALSLLSDENIHISSYCGVDFH